MELEAALLATYDLMWRGLLQHEFIVVGETGKCIYENRPLTGDGIDIIIAKHKITPNIVSMLKEWTEAEITEKGFVMKVGQIPVRCKFITDDWEFLKHPDLKVYGAEQYMLPNPFSEYEKLREFV